MQMFHAAVFLLCFAASLLCLILLVRTYRHKRAKLLLWTALSFVGLAANNLLVFVDLARGIGAIPVRRISSRQLKLDANAFGPPLKIAEKIMLRAGARNPFPDALPPALVRFFDQHVRLDAQRAQRELDLTWTPYETGLAQSTAWFMQTQS